MTSCRGFGSLTSEIETLRNQRGKQERMIRLFWTVGNVQEKRDEIGDDRQRLFERCDC